MASGVGLLVSAVLNGLAGVVAGAIVFGVVTLGQRFTGRKAAA